MKNNQKYINALKEAQIAIEDIKTRGSDAIGSDAIEYINSILTPSERDRIDHKVENARLRKKEDRFRFPRINFTKRKTNV